MQFKQELTRSHVCAAADISPLGEIDATRSQRDVSSVAKSAGVPVDGKIVNPHERFDISYLIHRQFDRTKVGRPERGNSSTRCSQIDGRTRKGTRKSTSRLFSTFFR